MPSCSGSPHGDTTVVCNYGVLTEGFDLPDIRCVVLARPTRQLGLYRQMVGRGLRPAPDKDKLVVLDHGGRYTRMARSRTVSNGRLSAISGRVTRAHNAKRQIRDTDGRYKSRIIDCTKCGAKRISGEPCTACGYFPQRPPKAVTFDDGDLALYDKQARKADAVEHDAETMATWHGMLLHIQQDREATARNARRHFHDKVRLLAATRRPAEANPANAGSPGVVRPA